MPFSRSQYREVTASRNLADGPVAISRYTGCVATLPTAQTIVSFIALPSHGRAPPPAPAGSAYGPVPYGCVCRDGRVTARCAAVAAAIADRVAIAAKPDCPCRTGPAERCGPPPSCGHLRHPDESPVTDPRPARDRPPAPQPA
ncbi:hypothetical protein GCM10010398_07510 [Streptomyces fimbriatus]